MKRTCSVAVVLLAAICGFADEAQAAPLISTISPSSGTTLGGTQVTITGTDLGTNPADINVTFGGVAATNLITSGGTTLFVTTPAYPTAGPVDVTVIHSGGGDTKLSGFTYVAADGPAPTVSSVSPTKGTTVGGTAIKIIGSNFRANATVRIGDVNATNPVVDGSGQTITAVTPGSQGGLPGAVSVTVINTDTTSGSLVNGFAYSAQCDNVITTNCIDQLLVNNASPPAGISGELIGTGTGLQVSMVNSGNPADRFKLDPAVTVADEIKVVLKVGTGLDPVIGLSTGDIQNQGLKWNATTRLATLTLKPRASSWSANPALTLVVRCRPAPAHPRPLWTTTPLP